MHEVGTSGNAALAIDKRRAVAEILMPHLIAAGYVPPIGRLKIDCVR